MLEGITQEKYTRLSELMKEDRQNVERWWEKRLDTKDGPGFVWPDRGIFRATHGISHFSGKSTIYDDIVDMQQKNPGFRYVLLAEYDNEVAAVNAYFYGSLFEAMEGFGCHVKQDSIYWPARNALMVTLHRVYWFGEPYVSKQVYEYNNRSLIAICKAGRGIFKMREHMSELEFAEEKTSLPVLKRLRTWNIDTVDNPDLLAMMNWTPEMFLERVRGYKTFEALTVQP